MVTLHHVALSVSDMAASIAFCLDLNFEPAYHWQVDDGSLRITHLKPGQDACGQFRNRWDGDISRDTRAGDKLRPVFPGLNQHRVQPCLLSTADVGFDVITDHDRLGHIHA